MGLKRTFNYQTRLYLIVNVFVWILVFVFVSVQYSREKDYKVSLLDTRLQVYNDILLHDYRESDTP